MQETENNIEEPIKLLDLDDEFLTVDDVLLCPGLGVLESRKDAELESFIYSSPMDTVTGRDLTKAMIDNGHYAVVCRFTKKDWFKSLEEYYDNPNVFFAIGSKKTDTEDLLAALMLVDTDEKISINIDVAHGDTRHMHALYQWYSEQDYIGNIMSGNICTPDAAMRAVNSGCTHLRVGIGPGSACTTRVQTGCGLPQLAAIFYIDATLKLHGVRDKIKIIADGGVRTPGDAVKYLAAGADGIMLGRCLANTTESQGWFNIKEHWWSKGKLAKRYRGQASKEFQKEVLGANPKCAEGVTGDYIYPVTNVKEVIEEFEGGVRSALSYLGLHSMQGLNPDNVTFIKISPSAQTEGTPHGV